MIRSDDAVERQGPGRPRDLARRDAVLSATCELLAARGYDALTISEVATHANVGRQMIYRWWPTKRDLVAEALFAGNTVVWPDEFTGGLEEDLRSFVSTLIDFALRPAVQSGMAGLLADFQAGEPVSPALDAVINHAFVGPLHDSFQSLCEAGWARGDLRPDVDVPMTLTTLRGAVTGHVLHVPIVDAKAVVDHLVWLLASALTARPR